MLKGDWLLISAEPERFPYLTTKNKKSNFLQKNTKELSFNRAKKITR